MEDTPEALTPMTELSDELNAANLKSSQSKKVSFTKGSPSSLAPLVCVATHTNGASEDGLPAGDERMETGGTPLTSRSKRLGRSSSSGGLLARELRLGTPPGRCGTGRGRLTATQLSFDENSPIGASPLSVTTDSPVAAAPSVTSTEDFASSPSTFTLVVRQRSLLRDLQPSPLSHRQRPHLSESDSHFRFLLPSGLPPKKTESPRRCLKFCDSFSDSLSQLSQVSTDSGISDGWFSELSQETAAAGGDDEPVPLPDTLGLLLTATATTPSRRKRRGSSPTSPDSKRPRPLSDRASRENRVGRRGKPAPRHHTITVAPKGKVKGTLFQYGFTKKPAASAEAQPSSDNQPESDLDIKLALQRSMKEELIGDFTRPFALPLMAGKHMDLKSISSDTLAGLLNGQYDDTIASYKIIDCRYPYEFEGGHIKGAKNLYTCEDIRKELLVSPGQPEDENGKRNILIFHCEFSSERGPFLSRFLRKEDRKTHSDTYPSLAYPEMYLLHGGYSAFFESHPQLCDPQSYRKMQDPAHSADLKIFKQHTKSWAPSSHRKLAIRSLSRL